MQPPKPLPDASTARWQSTDGAEIVTLPLVAIAAFTQVMRVVSECVGDGGGGNGDVCNANYDDAYFSVYFDAVHSF